LAEDDWYVVGEYGWRSVGEYLWRIVGECHWYIIGCSVTDGNRVLETIGGVTTAYVGK
jgi:hypothetical protein